MRQSFWSITSVDLITTVTLSPFNEVQQRIASEPVNLRVMVQLAQDGDITDDATVRWPESRQLLMFGEITLTEVAPDNPADQQWIIFDPEIEES